jgi:hypothetical protein
MHIAQTASTRNLETHPRSARVEVRQRQESQLRDNTYTCTALAPVAKKSSVRSVVSVR